MLTPALCCAECAASSCDHRSRGDAAAAAISHYQPPLDTTKHQTPDPGVARAGWTYAGTLPTTAAAPRRHSDTVLRQHRHTAPRNIFNKPAHIVLYLDTHSVAIIAQRSGRLYWYCFKIYMFIYRFCSALVRCFIENIC